MTSRTEMITPSLLRGWPLPHDEQSKHDRGHVLVIGGCRATPGAALLAGLAALRVGAGVLTMAVAESVAVPLAVAVPESGVIGLPETDRGSVRGVITEHAADALTLADVVVLGPGLDNPTETSSLLRAVVQHLNSGCTVLLDAYALGVLADMPDVVEALHGRMVLTPNREEAHRLARTEPVGSGQESQESLTDLITHLAADYQAVVTCQGIVAAPDARWEVSSGFSGLATAGSGDVLAGTVGGLLARGCSPAQAACWGTHLHAASGDRLAAGVGPLGFIARELVAELPTSLGMIEV